MKKQFKYLRYVLTHKFWVGYYCFRSGLIWRGIKHDWTKFLLSEWIPYSTFDFTTFRKGTDYAYSLDPTQLAFNIAWNHHQKSNDHHWQYFVLLEDDGGTFPLPMPLVCRREMIADWRGAGRAQGHTDTIGWYTKNKSKMQLHSDTRAWIEKEIGYVEV